MCTGSWSLNNNGMGLSVIVDNGSVVDRYSGVIIDCNLKIQEHTDYGRK